LEPVLAALATVPTLVSLGVQLGKQGKLSDGTIQNISTLPKLQDLILSAIELSPGSLTCLATSLQNKKGLMRLCITLNLLNKEATLALQTLLECTTTPNLKMLELVIGHVDAGSKLAKVIKAVGESALEHVAIKFSRKLNKKMFAMTRKRFVEMLRDKVSLTTAKFSYKSKRRHDPDVSFLTKANKLRFNAQAEVLEESDDDEAEEAVNSTVEATLWLDLLDLAREESIDAKRHTRHVSELEADHYHLGFIYHVARSQPGSLLNFLLEQ
jgi:hypothetical protein